MVRVLSGEGLRVAVVGLGKMGLLHASILNVLSNVKLTAVCEKSGMTCSARCMQKKCILGFKA